MKINWKARFKNKVFVVSLITLIISVLYKVLSVFEIVPNVSESEALEVFSYLVDVLSFVGILVDPTTDGINDSDRAMLYFTDLDGRDVEE
jgi:phi LC3 family holin